MATYEICGTCTIQCGGAKTIIRLFPTGGYLSPDKSRAVLYPSGDKSETRETAYLRTLAVDEKNEKHRWLVFDETPQTEILPILQLAAATQRKIQLTVEVTKVNLKITGCLFPAP